MSENTPTEVNRIAWNESVWFSDIDDTLIDTEGASLPGSEGIRKVFAPHCGEDKADEVQAHFNQLFCLMVDGYRVQRYEDWQNIDGGKPAFDALVASINARQTLVQDAYKQTKKWSREIFIKLAAEKAGVPVGPDLVHEAADAYWIMVTEETKVFPDARALSDLLYQKGRPLYLITSSDARLKMRPDGQFTYDPAYSEALKRLRLEKLRDKGLIFNLITIGDPEDKPHLDFFSKALAVAETDQGHRIEHGKAIMLGDSFVGDLLSPKTQLGFGLVVLREHGRKHIEAVDARQISVGNLMDAAKFLD